MRGRFCGALTLGTRRRPVSALRLSAALLAYDPPRSAIGERLVAASTRRLAIGALPISLVQAIRFVAASHVRLAAVAAPPLFERPTAWGMKLASLAFYSVRLQLS